MDFRELAAKEAAAFVQRAVKRSADAGGQQLDEARAALEAAAKAIAAASLSERDDQEAAEFASRLTKAASDAAAHAAKLAADEAQKKTNAVRAELEAAVKQKDAAAASLKDAQAQLDGARAELKTTKERSETISRQLGESRKFNEKLEIAKTELTAALDEMAKARAATEASLHDVRGKLDATRAELTVAAKNIEKAAADRAKAEEAAHAAHSASEASEAKLAAVADLFKQSGARVKALERDKQEYENTIHDLEARASGGAGPLQPSALPILDNLIAGFSGLGAAKSINDVLTALVAQMAKQFPRVALFRVKKSHLQGEQQIGFDLKTDIAKVVIPLGMDSLLAHAASSGRLEHLKGDELKEGGGAVFSGSPKHALAVPIMVAGEPLAILYVDDSGTASDLGRDGELDARYAEAMQQHAAALIARLTNELKAITELRAYAASLLRELEQMHEADVQGGLAGEELQARLKGNVDYARDVYNARVTHESTDAAPFFEDELSVMIASQNGSAFGRDLAAAAGREAGSRSAAS